LFAAERNFELLAAVAVFVGTFVAYAVGAFTVDGGVILLPQDATYVGTLVAAGIGYRRGSLLGAWVSLFAAYLGFDAEWAFLGLPSHSLAGKLEFLLGPEGIAISAAASILFGSIAYAVSYLVGLGLERARCTNV
jgi:hypothetical protein